VGLEKVLTQTIARQRRLYRHCLLEPVLSNELLGVMLRQKSDQVGSHLTVPRSPQKLDGSVIHARPGPLALA
ncbi:uncharacterized protein METZ01_LOCUS398217, partial [marine metagenome]